MTSVISLRLPSALARTIYQNAMRSNATVAGAVCWILAHALDSQFSFSTLPDPRRVLDTKLDVRLPSELVARIRTEAQRLNVSVSVYSRVILFAYFTKRLVVIDIGGRYTLAKNHAEKKSA
jgi:hypothetical protein